MNPNSLKPYKLTKEDLEIIDLMSKMRILYLELNSYQFMLVCRYYTGGRVNYNCPES